MSEFKPWCILHVDLKEPLPALPLSDTLQGYYAVFWWFGVPLGHQMIPAARLPMPASELTETALEIITPAVGSLLLKEGFKPTLSFRNPAPDRSADFDKLMALSRPLEQLSGLQAILDATTFREPVSVVICTRNRPESLERCLTSLNGLSQSPHEIIVVDNAPETAATRDVVARFPQITYVAEAHPGLGRARNAGISNSTGDVVAFTDDDVEVHTSWINRLQLGFKSPEVMVVTGLVLPSELRTKAQCFFEKHNSFGQGYRSKVFDRAFFERTLPWAPPVWSIGAGANMAVRRKAFETLGGFDERLGAGASGCSEDSEFWYRILAEGGICRYEPAAVVFHRHRDDMAGYQHQMRQYARGHVTALLYQFERYWHGGNLYRAFGSLPSYYLKSLLRRVRYRGQPDGRMLRAQMRGYLSGLRYYWRHRSHPAGPYSTDAKRHTLSKFRENQNA